MAAVKTWACRFGECGQRVSIRNRYCDQCAAILREQWQAMRALLRPRRQPYTPRVVAVLRHRRAGE